MPLQIPQIPASQLSAAGDPARRFRLLEQVRRALRCRHYSRRTELTYCAWVRRFVQFHNRRHPSTMGEEEIAAFLNHLATNGDVSASTQNQALHSLLFLYRHALRRPLAPVSGLTPARRGRRLPVVLSPPEVRAILEQMRGVPRLCASLMYGSGLRVMECASLRVKDVDFDRGEILVRGGKGDKDRRVPLPRLAVPALRAQIELVRVQFERDLRAGVTGASLPGALTAKHQHAHTRQIVHLSGLPRRM